MAKGRKTGGRQKGTPNKTTAIAKEAIAHAAEALGGQKRLAQWAQESPENERAFWVQVYPKLLPLQVTGDGGGPLAHSVTVEFVSGSRPAS